MKDTYLLNQINDQYKDRFLGSFHSLLWQIIVNKIHENKTICFTTIINSGYEIGIAIENEPGYIPTSTWFNEKYYFECEKTINEINQNIFGLDTLECFKIVATSMRN